MSVITQVGDIVSVPFSVTNNGIAAATGVVMNITVPPGMAVLSGTPSQGTFNTGTGIWSIGAMLSGATETNTVIFQITDVSKAPWTITSQVTASQKDNVPSNNTGSIIIQYCGNFIDCLQSYQGWIEVSELDDSPGTPQLGIWYRNTGEIDHLSGTPLYELYYHIPQVLLVLVTDPGTTDDFSGWTLENSHDLFDQTREVKEISATYHLDDRGAVTPYVNNTGANGLQAALPYFTEDFENISGPIGWFLISPYHDPGDPSASTNALDGDEHIILRVKFTIT